MIYTPKYFRLEELVCPDVFKHYGIAAWSFLDDRILKTGDFLREVFGPAELNTWHKGGANTQSGLRCLFCGFNADAFKTGKMYMSAHSRGLAEDLHFLKATPEEVRQWIIANPDKMPFPCRLENGVAWVHIDCVDTGQKVLLFNP